MPKLIENSRLYIAAFGFVLAVLYGSAASRLSIPAFSDPVGPRLFPYMLAVGLCVASLALILEHVVTAKKRREAAASEEDGMTRIALVALGMLTIYYVVFDYLGFLVSSALFLIAFLSYSNRGQWKTNILISVFFPLAIYILLDRLLGARLPDGILDFG